MLKFFRSKHSQYFVFVILALLFLSFLFYSNAGSSLIASSQQGGNDHGKIDGNPVSAQDAYQAQTTARIEAMFDPNIGRPIDPNPSIVWVNLLFQDQAQKLAITVPDDAALNFVHENPLFADEKGVYQPARYAEIIQGLASRGISEDDFTTALDRRFQNEAVTKAMFGNIHATKADDERNFKQMLGPVHVSIWHFNPAAFAADIKVTSDEAKAEFTAHPEDPAYHQDEQREVQYVVFHPPAGLTNDTATKEQKAPMVSAAANFSAALQPVPGSHEELPTFEQEAAKYAEMGAKVQDSGLFSIHTPAQGLPPSPHFNNAAFALTDDHPVSQLVAVPNGVAVMKLVKVVQGPLKEFSAVEKMISEKMRTQRAKLAMAQTEADFTSGKIVGPALLSLAASGKITENKLTFDPTNPPPEIPRYTIHEIENLQDGDMSTAFDETQDPDPREPIKTLPNPLTVVRVDSRDAVSKVTHELYWVRFCQQQDTEYQQQAEGEWVQWRSEQAGTEPLKGTRFGKASQQESSSNLPSE